MKSTNKKEETKAQLTALKIAKIHADASIEVARVHANASIEAARIMAGK